MKTIMNNDPNAKELPIVEVDTYCLNKHYCVCQAYDIGDDGYELINDEIQCFCGAARYIDDGKE